MIGCGKGLTSHNDGLGMGFITVLVHQDSYGVVERHEDRTDWQGLISNGKRNASGRGGWGQDKERKIKIKVITM